MTKDAARTDRASGLSVAGWPLRRKIALALAIPLLLAATLGALRVGGDVADSTSAGRSAEQVTIIKPAIDYLTASEAAMVAAQTDSAAAQGDLIDAIDDIVTSAETLTEVRDNAELDELQTAHVDALLDLSQAMRGDEAQNLGPATWVALVRQLESSVSRLITSVNAASSTPEPRLEQLSQAMSGRLSLAMQQGLVANTELAQSGSQELFSELGVEASAIDRLAGSVEGAEDLTAELRTANQRHASQIREDSATDLGGRDAYQPYDEITELLIDGVTTSLTEAASAARNSALFGAFMTLVALAAAIALAIAVARSLLEPIGKVREGALAVARHRLPDAVARIRAGEEPEPIKPIDVTTNEEIGQVARAVDDLHRQAIHLASGEAHLRQTVNAMFVTLSRRSNSLVNQQLAQIERLEHDEEDPKRLESLFRLDHLASRMRRTADSLLILADAPSRASGILQPHRRRGTAGRDVGCAGLPARPDPVPPRHPHQRRCCPRRGAPADRAGRQRAELLAALRARTPRRQARRRRRDDHGHRLRPRRPRRGAGPAQPRPVPRCRGHARHRAPDGTLRGLPPGRAPRCGRQPGEEPRWRHDGHRPAPAVHPSRAAPDRRSHGRARGRQDLDPEHVDARSGRRCRRSRGAHDGRHVRRRADQASGPGPRPRPFGEVGRQGCREGRRRRGEGRREGCCCRGEGRGQGCPQGRRHERARAPRRGTRRRSRRSRRGRGLVERADPGRPSLDSLLPRREPGANIPRTGADAFEPTTSGETGPLFGKRTPDAAPEPAESVDQSAEGAESPEPAASDDSSDIGQVASVVSITALASRQRAQAEEARASEEARGRAEESEAEDTVEEPAAERRGPTRSKRRRGGRRGARRRDPSRPADRPAVRRGLRRRTGRGRAGHRARGSSRARAEASSRA